MPPDSHLHQSTRHPDLTVTETGCHVWRGSTYERCFKHGTEGCCLVAHKSPAAQRAWQAPRCAICKRFLSWRDPYADNCGRWECLVD